MDTNQSNALDKTVAGDTLSGVVAMASTAALMVNAAGATIVSAVVGGIQSAIAGGFESDVVGGFRLAGGATDWPTFSATRSRLQVAPMIVTSLAAGWTTATIAPWNIAPATGTPQAFYLPYLHNGATLASVTVFISVTGPHSGVPAVLPSIAVVRYLTSGAISAQALASSSPQSFTPAPGTAAAWDDTNQIQGLLYTCNQNNVIDTTQYHYGAVVIDENGANAVAGNKYIGVLYTYSGIANMAFP